MLKSFDGRGFRFSGFCMFLFKLAALLFSAASSVATADSLDRGMVAYWHFDEVGADSMTPCLIDKNQNARIVRSERVEGEFNPKFEEGMLGRAFRSGGQFGQFGYFAVIENPPRLEDAFTVAFWTKPLAGQWLTQLIYYKSRSVFSSEGFALRLDGTRLSLSLGDRELLSSEASVAQKCWSFMAFSWDGRIWRLYENGSLAAESRTHPPFTAPDEGIPMNIGGLNVQMNTVYQGLIDEFRVWDRALSEKSIGEVMLNDLQRVAALED